ncbi:MAG: bifunctional oligoribonuclease/PAP phosphatase NrnA [Candidatus Amulumruptor caecigallinarius]|nr:bifunctional oligoribonuclease/PAP phosphatase NrnA [Candidatus Amulumruptor caecigallinarius]
MKSILNPSSVREFISLVENRHKIILTCHMRPDGDAIGSCLGLYHLLTALGNEVHVVIPDRLPRSLMFLPGVNDVVVNSQYDPYCVRLVGEADLIIMCDFNTASRQGDLASVITAAKADKVLIDHHQNPDINCKVMFSFPDMSSTCELVFRLIAACGWYGMLNKDGATALLTGLVTDTQNFTVSCNNPEVYEVMMRLLEKGVNKKQIVDEALKSCSLASMRLTSFALLERMEIFEKSRAALIVLSKDDLDNFKYQKGDTEGLVNMPLNIRGMVYSIFMREDNDCIKVSTRSKFNFPVSDICRDLFNGGGHIMAAGGEFYGSLEDCRNLFLKNMHKYDKFIPGKLEKLEV